MIVHRQSVKVYIHMYHENVQQNLSPVLAYDFLSRCKSSTPTSTHLYSSIDKLYAQNPVFEIVHKKSVKVYLHMYNGNVQ